MRCELPGDEGVCAEDWRGVKHGRSGGYLAGTQGALMHDRETTIDTAPMIEVGETMGRG